MANSCQSAHAAHHIKEGLVCFGPWQNRKKKTGSDKGGWELYCENPRSQDILLQKETPHIERNKDALRAFLPPARCLLPTSPSVASRAGV